MCAARNPLIDNVRSVAFLTSRHSQLCRSMMRTFPIDPVIPQLLDAFRTSRSVILSAPPGAGKTTRVPLALLEQKWMDGARLIMLEPRRLAAKHAAEFMASLRSETVGGTVGYRTRGDSRVSRTTRIEVVTEGVLTRMLQEKPDLPGVSVVVFDEFHERSLHADLGLALTLEVQENLRNDLRVLVMSATLDGVALSRLLHDAPIVESVGQSYPVDTRYLSSPHHGPIEPKVAETIRRALNEIPGDILAFLPGQREIHRVERMLRDEGLSPDVSLHTLHGDASDESQRAALTPAPHGIRKVILSTSIAETSLTIDGVRVVVDAGLARTARFDPRRGMSGLVTTSVSRATADQRRGRAGRQHPGVCYRLWTETQHQQLSIQPVPEILSTDLAPFALELARWGAGSSDRLRFLDQPPQPHLVQAKDLLQKLGALNEVGTLTPHGRQMSEFPVHPRLAHMLIRGRERDLGPLACDVAALLEERDLLRGRQGVDIDFTLRWFELRNGAGHDRVTRNRVLGEARRLREHLGVAGQQAASEKGLGILLALAYPERIAKRRSNEGGRYQMAGGTGAVLPEWSLLGREDFLVIAEVDGVGTEVRVFLAAPVLKSDILGVFADRIVSREEVFWSAREEMVVARRAQMLDALIIEEQSAQPRGSSACVAMVEGIRQMGIASLPWERESESLRSRSEWLRVQQLVTSDWPELSDEHLVATLDRWLSPFLDGIARRAHLAPLDMQAILKSFFSYPQLRDLDRLAPVTLTVPTGSQIRLEYSAGTPPILAVRLQEMFGQTDTPTVAGGRVNVLIHLLSPARRLLAVTQDLRSFWINAYPEVRKEMRGRYPKHPWPENPMDATPTRRTKRST